jgi:hypothetical protein
MLHAARLSTQMMGSVSDVSLLQVPVHSPGRILVQSTIFSVDAGRLSGALRNHS